MSLQVVLSLLQIFLWFVSLLCPFWMEKKRQRHSREEKRRRSPQSKLHCFSCTKNKRQQSLQTSKRFKFNPWRCREESVKRLSSKMTTRRTFCSIFHTPFWYRTRGSERRLLCHTRSICEWHVSKESVGVLFAWHVLHFVIRLLFDLFLRTRRLRSFRQNIKWGFSQNKNQSCKSSTHFVSVFPREFGVCKSCTLKSKASLHVDRILYLNSTLLDYARETRDLQVHHLRHQSQTVS